MSVALRFKKISFTLSIAVCVIGLLVLIGWGWNISLLKSIYPDWRSFKANAAISFILAGITLVLINKEKKDKISRNLSGIFSLIILTIGTLTILEYVFNFNAGIDELFFKETGGAYSELPPGRQSPFSAAYFMIFGLCYLSGTSKLAKKLLFHFLHITSGIIVLAAALSYLFGSYIILGVSLDFIYIMHSTLSFLFLILAVLFSLPETGIMKIVSSETSGGKIVRKTLPLGIFSCIILGWLQLKGERAGLYNTELGITIFIIAMIIVLGYLIISDAASFTKTEQKLRESEQRLNRAELMGSLGHGYYDIKKGKMYLSDGLYKIFGVTPEKFSHTIEGLKSVIHPDDYQIQDKAVDTMLEKGEVEVEFRIVRPSGEIRNVLFRTVLMKNEKGELTDSFTTALCITDRKKAETRIREYNEQLKQLAARQQDIREEERARIGREVHDELGQWLAVLKMEISRLKKMKADGKNTDDLITEILEQVDGCIKTSKRIATELRPTLIDDLGLIAALEWQAEEFGKRTHIKSTFKTDIDKLELPKNFTIAIFRIFQESLTNVARHAEATAVISSLYIQDKKLVLTIKDNGKGFDTGIIGSKKTMGLMGMKERAMLMNGTYSIHSFPEKGTEISVVIPLS